MVQYLLFRYLHSLFCSLPIWGDGTKRSILWWIRICFHQRHVSYSHNVCNEHVCQHFLITSLSRLSCRMLPTTVARSNYTKTLSCFCVMNPEPLAYTDSPQTAILFSVMQIRNQPTVDSLFLVANPGLEPESPPWEGGVLGHYTKSPWFYDAKVRLFRDTARNKCFFRPVLRFFLKNRRSNSRVLPSAITAI